jgi:protein TonB
MPSEGVSSEGVSTVPVSALRSDEAIGPGQRRALALAVLGLHAAAGWALLQIDPVRQAVGELAPVFVAWVAPPAVTPPPTPLPSVAVPEPMRPRPLVTAAPAPAPAAFLAPPPAPEPAPVVVEAPAPPALPVPVAPPAPLTTPPAPKTISITAVEYLWPPQLTYPSASRRLLEHGTVHVRVLVDSRGAPQQIHVTRSSGFARLDEAALATVRATRFKPYAEDGVALPFWVVMPLIFELES